MGCGRSKRAKSVSPSEERNCDYNPAESGDGSVANGRRAKQEHCPDRHPRHPSTLALAPATCASIDQLENLTKHQQEFFRQLDEKINEGQELDSETLERDSLWRRQQLLSQWPSARFSLSVTATATTTGGTTTSLLLPPPPAPLPAAASVTVDSGEQPTDCKLNGAPLGGASLNAPTTDDPASRSERSFGRGSRRSARSGSLPLCSPPTTTGPLQTVRTTTTATTTTAGTPPPTTTAATSCVASERDCESTAASGGGGCVSVSKLLQLGDVYVSDLDVHNPDSFVRMGRRASVYDEVAIPEESVEGSVVVVGQQLSVPTVR